VKKGVSVTADDSQKPERGKKEEKPDLSELFAGRCILLVEDVEINREIVLALFEPAPLKIECAENGIEAVRKFSEAPDRYDLIFMDVQMPEMDGYEATRQIRALDIPKARSIPIIAMTANVFREDIEKCKAAGMNDHIGKPLNFDEVLDRLNNYLPK
jgi:CheY-like chemotaxis protein